jgi:two-component system, chemotaxis family, protein-glutamate methylesterase/glutaminase
MKTRVLVVDDSPLIRAVLREAFERTSDLLVVGEAGDGDEAVAKVQAIRPDIVTMDVVMPKMDGLAATREIMRVCPTPILVIARDRGDARALAVAALGHGALGVFPKPEKGFDHDAARELADQIRQVVGESGRISGSAGAGMSPAKRIRVLVVDDSSLVRELLRTALVQAGDIEVVGEAGDGITAVRMASELRPDVVTLDLLMPLMDGYETAENILRTCSPGILVVSQEKKDANRLLDNLSARAAVELYLKPSTGLDGDGVALLVGAIRRLACEAASRLALPSMPVRHVVAAESARISIIGIAGSTGAPRVLRDLLAGLPSDFPVPVVLVQHTERGFSETLVAWLGSVASLPVRLGTAGHVLLPGEIVVSPDDLHMEVHTGGIVHLHSGEPVDGFRPSGSILLASLARSFGAHAAGLVLSGMGNDGAEGLAAIDASGGLAMVEDPETAAVPGMPSRALGRAPGALVERASRLAWLLIELAGGHHPRPALPVSSA